MVVPVTSTLAPTLNMSALNLGAGLQVRAFFLAEAELDERTARSGARLGVMAGHGLRQQRLTTLAVRDLHGAIAVLVTDFTWVTRFGRTSTTVTGMVSPGFREHSRHAALAAD